MRAAIYGRVSTDRQSELSIEAQIEYCENYCRKNGWQIVNHYTDFGLSGTSIERRPGLMQMIADARDGQFDIVVAHKVDRAFRNTRDYENVKFELEKFGVILAFAETGMNDGGNGDFLNGLMALMAAQYSKNLSREVMKTVRKNVEAGNFMGGLPPLGYKIENKKFVIDDETAPLIDFIFTSYASGEYSMRSLAEHINSLGFLTSRGRPFTISTIHGILKNEKYRGVYVHNLHQFKKFGKKIGKKTRKDTDVIRMSGLIPRLVSDKVWEAVQKKMESNKSQKCNMSRAKRTYLLSGLLKCSECGSNYVGSVSKNQKGTEVRYYICNGRKRRLTSCDNMPINADWLEEQALKCIARLCDEMDLEKLTKDANQAIRDLLKDQKEEIDRQKAKIAKMHREESNIIDAIAAMGLNDALQKRLESVQKDIALAEDRLEAITPRIIPVVDTATVSHMFQLTIKDIQEGTDEQKMRAIQSVVDSIKISKDKVLIKIKAGLSKAGFSRHDEVADPLVAEAGFEPATFGL